MKLLSSSFKRIFFNSSWMVAEQLLRIASGLLVGVYIARHIGPESFGVLSYGLAISTFLIAISRIGMQAILIRELSNLTGKLQSEMLGTAFWMMQIAAAVFFLLALLIILGVESSDEIRLLILILCSSAFFSSFLVIDYYYQSETKSKISSICKSVAITLTSALKIILIHLDADLKIIVYSFLAEHIITACILLLTIKNKKIFFFSNFSSSTAKKLFKSCVPMLLATISGIMLVKTDQIMIGAMIGMEEVGIYAAAVKIYEAWIIIPFIISLSLLPIFIKLKKNDNQGYEKAFINTFRYTVSASLLAVIFVSFFGKDLILVSFGEDYADSYSVLLISMWTALFVSVGSISGRYFTVEGYERKIAARTFIALLANIIFNLILIPIYGIEGAAAAGLVAMFLSAYLLDWVDKDLRTLLYIKHRSVIPFLKWRMR